ncbi:MAG TPA: histidine kinase [Longimicrobiaceae bacterium]|nr:histidine kinase [Longimicrobiaceae bacterium]
MAPLRERDVISTAPSHDRDQTDRLTTGLSRTAHVFFLSCLFWTVVVLLMTTRKYVARRIVWPPADFGRMLQGLAPDYLAYAVLTPLVIAAAARLPVLDRGWRRWMAHLGLGLLFSATAATLTAAADYTLYPTLPHQAPPPTWVRAGYHFATHFSDDLVAYAVILLGAHAVAYYRAYRAREIRAAQLEARLSRAQLEALRSQIQPHFLFNTLHSISALMTADVAGARKMIGDLKALLRLSLERSDEQEVPLATELAFLEQYVSIQRTRFRDRLTLEYSVSPDALTAVVPRLILQPLVENALRHGLASRSAPGRIQVEARCNDGRVHLVVADDGVGTGTADGLPPREGIGLGNTRARLRALYGDRQALDARGGSAGGFRVEVVVPHVAAPAVPIEDGLAGGGTA